MLFKFRQPWDKDVGIKCVRLIAKVAGNWVESRTVTTS